MTKSRNSLAGAVEGTGGGEAGSKMWRGSGRSMRMKGPFAGTTAGTASAFAALSGAAAGAARGCWAKSGSQGAVKGEMEKELAGMHAALFAGLANGTIRPVVSSKLPLADAIIAHHAVIEKSTLGKIVLIP